MAELTEHTFFPFSAHPYCAPPESEELIDTLRRVLQQSATDSGTQFKRNHASVVYGCQLIERRMARDPLSAGSSSNWNSDSPKRRQTPLRQTHEVYAMTRITWHNVLLGAPVWAVRRGHWQAAIVISRGRAGCRVKFIDTGHCARRRYQELAGRCAAKNANDRPPDEVQHGQA